VWVRGTVRTHADHAAARVGPRQSEFAGSAAGTATDDFEDVVGRRGDIGLEQ
jgi:hypothetical protein